MHTLSTRVRRTVISLVAAAVVIFGASVAPAAFAEPSSDASTGIAIVNGARAGADTQALAHSDYLQHIAQAWAEELAANGSVDQNPNTGLLLPPGWSDWAETDGAAGGPADIVNGWLGSADADLLTSGGYNVVGMGFAAASNGTVYGVSVLAWYDDPASVGAEPVDGTTPPAPSDPAPSEPAPSEPAPSEPAPSEPAPSEPAPSEPAPSEPAPSEPAPSEPAPSEPAPSEPAPSEPAPSPSESAPAGAPGGGDSGAPRVNEPGGEAGGGTQDALPLTGTENAVLIGATTLFGLLVLVSGSAFFLYYRQSTRPTGARHAR